MTITRNNPPDTPHSRSPLRESVVPVQGHIVASESMESALKHLDAAGVDYLVLTDPVEGPRGVVSRSDIEQLQRKYPDYWSDMRCGNAIVASDRFLTANDSFDEAVGIMQQEGTRPLLVLEEDTVYGVLEPTAVLRWCAEHRPEALQELALQDLG
ncbi:CBS domain-containing protein [Nesterenkonia haasae]|uniref:CBS domain-containing protein n=1 Tax=Nesterenkonia haasae TaxID=2587813 RepID=UPI001391D1D2|nr:CBS domain-containing protein [Nesterenkonia haasae]NDK32197.1 CBS domain-containing protein [Nesterenkonia haasae]